MPVHLHDSFEITSEAAGGDPIEIEDHAILYCAGHAPVRSLLPEFQE